MPGERTPDAEPARALERRCIRAKLRYRDTKAVCGISCARKQSDLRSRALAFPEIAGRLRRAGVAVSLGFQCLRKSFLQTIKTYSTRVDADLARMTLDAAGVPSQVIGVGTDFEGGAGGVRLVVADEHVEEARRVLEDL